MKLPWRWRRAQEALGPAGWVGLGLLAAAAVWQACVNLPLGQQAHALRSEMAQLAAADTPARSAAARAPGALPQSDVRGGRLGATLTEATPLASFESLFPPLAALPELLARIEQGAAAQRVELHAGEYRLERRADEAWLRYRISLPVRARYAQLRGLIDHVLVQLPTAALDDIEFQREGGDANAPLQARLRFTLFLRP